MEEQASYTPVKAGYWKCRAVFVDEKRKFVNGEAVETAHTILRVSVVPVEEDRSGVPAPENAQVYSFDLPLMYDPGETWRFWDDVAKSFVERKPTAKDTEAALKKAREAIPEWDKFITERAQNHNEVFGWFYGDEFKGVELTCKLKEPRSYPGSDGLEHFAYDAILIAPKAKVTAAAWTANKEKAAKAFIKLPSKGKSPAPAKAPPAAPKPPAPAAPSAVEESTQETAWNAYCAAGLDPANWWSFAADVTGKEAETCATWTSADWRKVEEAAKVPPF